MTQEELILTLAWAANRLREAEDRISADDDLIRSLRKQVASLAPLPPSIQTRTPDRGDDRGRVGADRVA